MYGDGSSHHIVNIGFYCGIRRLLHSCAGQVYEQKDTPIELVRQENVTREECLWWVRTGLVTTGPSKLGEGWAPPLALSGQDS